MPQLTSVCHLALDGESYAFETSEELDLSAPATSVAGVPLGGRLVEFTAGSVGLADAVAATLGIDAWEEELSFGGGVLRTARTVEREPRSGLVERPVLVSWRGRRCSLVARLYGASLTRVLALLRDAGIVERDEGVTLTAAGAGTASLIKEIAGVGLLEVGRRTRERGAELPPWSGVAVPTGELFRDTLTNGDPFFILAGEEVWATVVPLAGVAAEGVPRRLGGLTLRRMARR